MIVLVCDRLDEMLCQRLTLVFYGVWWFLTGKPSRVSTCARSRATIEIDSIPLFEFLHDKIRFSCWAGVFHHYYARMTIFILMAENE
jgi:hypothetical protein